MTDPRTTTGTLGTCWLCAQQSNRIESHVVDHDHYELAACNGAEGVSVDLCPMCHVAVHKWMRSNGRPGTLRQEKTKRAALTEPIKTP